MEKLPGRILKALEHYGGWNGLLTALDELECDAERWRFGARHGFPIFGYIRGDKAEWGHCVVAGTTHAGSTPEEVMDAAMNGANA